jgi:hypothetical protein
MPPVAAPPVKDTEGNEVTPEELRHLAVTFGALRSGHDFAGAPLVNLREMYGVAVAKSVLALRATHLAEAAAEGGDSIQPSPAGQSEQALRRVSRR